MFLLTTIRIFISYFILYQYGTSRDSPNAIFLADSDFRFFWQRYLPIPIFADSDFLSKNYNWQHIQTKIDANTIEKNIYIIK